jgi:hypothetical protein
MFNWSYNFASIWRKIQINQPTRCNSSTSLLVDVYVWLKIFRVLYIGRTVLKVQRYNIRSIALYGAEIWILRNIDEKYLVNFEMWKLVKDGEDQLDRLCGKVNTYYIESEERTILHAVKRRKSDILVARCVRTVSPVLHHVPKLVTQYN